MPSFELLNHTDTLHRKEPFPLSADGGFVVINRNEKSQLLKLTYDLGVPAKGFDIA